MKKRTFLSALFSMGAMLLVAGALAEGARAQAAYPFADGFESGALGPEWSIVPDPNGHIQVTGQYSPHGGDWHVAMDTAASGQYALNTLDLAIDLAGQSSVELTYWYKEYGDEDHPEDGCFVSMDGVNFHQVQSHNGGPSAWQQFTVDLDAACGAYGLNFTSTFVIRFQQYDNSALTSDGICIDDVAVGPKPVPSLSCDVTVLSASLGGKAYFTLDAGPAFANRPYVLLGSASGTTPGLPLPGGATLPLNPGLFLQCVRNHLNSWWFVHFKADLDGAGESFAIMDSMGPMPPMLAGKHLDFAYTTMWPFDFQSETVGIDIAP